ncbi:unnamed protein product [Protopolystoma xenopodis]|uniref:Uncharacterized protein n=1 Tax=Protopolystoma xenopodis TaxID=117903 RepID=A0A3S5BT17_9PLAT|nr:unnamed protein product [Protopolystoma xenopodis]
MLWWILNGLSSSTYSDTGWPTYFSCRGDKAIGATGSRRRRPVRFSSTPFLPLNVPKTSPSVRWLSPLTTGLRHNLVLYELLQRGSVSGTTAIQASCCLSRPPVGILVCVYVCACMCVCDKWTAVDKPDGKTVV